MKIYDISQEIFACKVYPGDKRPRMSADKRIKNGEEYNLTSFEMCAHNGTHIDAPFHFLENGATAERIPLENTIGFCFVTEQNEAIGYSEAEEIIKSAELLMKTAAKRILIKGTGVVTAEAARLFANAEILLLGVEGLSVGPEDSPMEVHKILLDKGVALLEGIRLTEVNPGVYFLCAQPLSLEGIDGSPCRAVLINNPFKGDGNEVL